MSENGNSNDGGNGGGGDANAWRAPLLQLAGDNAEAKTLIEGFKDQGEFLSRLKPVDAPDWRKSIAGEDADALKALERFNDGKSFFDSFKQKDDYIRSGTKVTVPGADASSEVIDAWNKARGVPDKADGYKIEAQPPEGVAIDDATKTMLAGITAELHKVGAEPAVVNLAHKIVYDQIAGAQTQHETLLTEGPKRATTELTKIWKNEAELKSNAAFASAGVQQYLGALDGDKAKSVLNIETADGFYLGDHPAFIQLMAAVGRASAEDPLYLAASGAGDNGKNVDAQIEEIYALRSTDMKKYNAPETQERLNKLLGARARHRELQSGKAA